MMIMLVRIMAGVALLFCLYKLGGTEVYDYKPAPVVRCPFWMECVGYFLCGFELMAMSYPLWVYAINCDLLH